MADESLRLLYFKRWCTTGEIKYRDKLYRLLENIAIGIFVRKMIYETDIDERKQAGRVALFEILELARKKEEVDPFNSLKGLNCYIMLGLQGRQLNSFAARCQDIPSEEWTIACRENKDFWLDYEMLASRLTDTQRTILGYMAEGRYLGEITGLMCLPRTRVWMEMKRITSVMAPLALYYKSEQAGREGVLEEEIEDDY